MSDAERFEALSNALGDAIEATIGDWVRRCVLTRLDRLDPDVEAAMERAADAATVDIGQRVRSLLAQDIDEQRTNPLSILRSAVRYPTEVLRLAALDPPGREAFAVQNFPDDVYDLTPASFADIDERLHEPGLMWGAAKAYVHLQRRRSAEQS